MIQTKERIRVLFIDDMPLTEANFSILREDKACQKIALLWTHSDITNRELSEMLLYSMEFQFGVDGRLYSFDTVYAELIKSYDKDDAYQVWKCRQKALFEFVSPVGWWFSVCGLLNWAKRQHQANK